MVKVEQRVTKRPGGRVRVETVVDGQVSVSREMSAEDWDRVKDRVSDRSAG